MVLSEQDVRKKLPQAMTKCLHTLQLEQSPFQHTKKEGDAEKGARKSMRAQQSLLTVCFVSSNITRPFSS